MYYWDSSERAFNLVASARFSSCQKNVLLGRNDEEDKRYIAKFQQLLEECTIGTMPCFCFLLSISCFSSCQKNVLLGRQLHYFLLIALWVSVVVRRMYYWDYNSDTFGASSFQFQQLLEECTIGTTISVKEGRARKVSVVVRRMYYWDRALCGN